MLRHGEAAECTRADPTGGRNLHFANELRRKLRDRSDVKPEEANRVVDGSRPAFKDAIYGRLELPELPDKAAA
jgi:hypothetical protein